MGIEFSSRKVEIVFHNSKSTGRGRKILSSEKVHLPECLCMLPWRSRNLSRLLSGRSYPVQLEILPWLSVLPQKILLIRGGFKHFRKTVMPTAEDPVCWLKTSQVIGESSNGGSMIIEL